MPGALHPQAAVVSIPPGSSPHTPAPTHDNDPDGAPPNKEVSPYSAATPESWPPVAVCSLCSPAHQNQAPQVSRATPAVKSCRPPPPPSPASRAFPAYPFPRQSDPECPSYIPAAPSAALSPRNSAPHRPDARQSPANQDSFPLRRLQF